jgi:phage gpG-like protein
MDSLIVRVDAERLLARLQGMEPKLHENLRRVITRLSVEAQGRVKSDKLSGQVLHVRTGTLRRSINRRVDDDGESVIATVGTNVIYAGRHEYGFHGIENVREHVRRSRAQMQLAKFRTNKLGERIEIKGSYTKAGGTLGSIIVRAHQRQANTPERSFLRSTLREMTPQIRREIKAAALAALQ